MFCKKSATFLPGHYIVDIGGPALDVTVILTGNSFNSQVISAEKRTVFFSQEFSCFGVKNKFSIGARPST